MNTPETETPRTDADIICDLIDKLSSHCKLNPTAYQREAKEKVRTLELENAQLRKELEETNESLKRCSWIAKVADNEKAARLEAEQACDHFRTLAAENWKLAEELADVFSGQVSVSIASARQRDKAIDRLQTLKQQQPK